MKKFISMVMAAAMVVTMVPATAFAATADVTASVANVWEVTSSQAGAMIVDGSIDGYKAPELQLTLNNVNASVLDDEESFEITLTLNNAEWRVGAFSGRTEPEGVVVRADNTEIEVGEVDITPVDGTEDDPVKKATVTITEAEGYNFTNGDVIVIPLAGMNFTKTKACDATVKVTGDLKAEPIVFASIVGKVLEASVEDVLEVAEDEQITLNADEAGVKIKAKVNYLPDNSVDNEDLTIKLSKGFEFVYFTDALTDDSTYSVTWEDEDELVVEMLNDTTAEIVIEGIEIASTTAKVGDIATLKVYADGFQTASVEVAKVIDHTVVMELVDPDEDVPVIYSGVNTENDGLTVNDSHISLEVKIYETFPGAWNMNKDFTLSLPEGVYVAEVDGVVAEDVNDTLIADDDRDELVNKFEAAYIKGDHEEFAFRKYTFENLRATDEKGHEMTFTLELVADPTFEGDVVLTLEGSAVDTQEVTIAKFVKPYTIAAEQNDVIIDYRYTAIDTAIVVTEAEAGLWEEGFTFTFGVDDNDSRLISFEDEADVEENEESDMVVEAINKGLGFTVKEESEDEAAVITISGMELFMQRNIPAGAYDLTVAVDTGVVEDEVAQNYKNELIFAPETAADKTTVGDYADYSTVAKEAFINVVTAGRDQSDSSFTTEVVVPVGESYLVAGDKQFTLDVPAYINANGYIMVPVRAVANALGIANDCVQWNQASKTVIIMYGDRLITMTAGSSVIYVGGTPLPSTSSVEIVDGRAFLGLRDLANALGVKSIDWNGETKVGTLNPKA